MTQKEKILCDYGSTEANRGGQPEEAQFETLTSFSSKKVRENETLATILWRKKLIARKNLYCETGEDEPPKYVIYRASETGGLTMR